MQLRLLDILADPDEPNRWPLKLHVIDSEIRTREHKPIPHKETNRLCKFYCARKDKFLVNDPLQDGETTLPTQEIDAIISLDECYECITTEIVNGILYYDLPSTRKWFLVDREIAVMYPANLRDIKQEKAFFAKHPNIQNELHLKFDYEL